MVLEAAMCKKECQLRCLPVMAEPLRIAEMPRQLRNRAKRIVKRRWRYLLNLVSAHTRAARARQARGVDNSPAGTLEPGDLVRVRQEEEIRATLDKWNGTKGCVFMEEMWPYCGTTQRVLKRVKKFLDERDYRVRRCKGIVLLEGAICEGTKDFGPCDRSCFLFWREEWLEKLEE